MRGRAASRGALLAAPRPQSEAEDREELYEWRRYVLGRLQAGEAPQMAPQAKRRARIRDSDALTTKKPREQEQLLALSTEKLWREMARLEALKRIREGSSFVTNFSECGAPMKIVYEFFTQFRYGVAGMAGVPPSLMMTTATKQQEFVDAMIEPGAVCYGIPAASAIIGGFAFKNKVHSSFRLERTATQIVTEEETVTIVSKVNNYLWYSLESVKALHPHILGNEKIMKKLVGRMLCVPLTMKLHFNTSGRLIDLTCDTDLMSGLMGVLGDMDECLKVLDDDGGADKLQQEPEEELSASECSDNSNEQQLGVEQPETDCKDGESGHEDKENQNQVNEAQTSQYGGGSSDQEQAGHEELSGSPEDSDGQPCTASR